MTSEVIPPPRPDPWATTDPREGLRDNNAAMIKSLTATEVTDMDGTTAVPGFANLVEFCGHDEDYSKTVRFTSQRVLLYRSRTQHVHGGGNGGRCEPYDEPRMVRIEGSPVMRHGDRFWMDDRRTIGEAVWTVDTNSYSAPRDSDPLPGSVKTTAAAGDDLVRPVDFSGQPPPPTPPPVTPPVMGYLAPPVVAAAPVVEAAGVGTAAGAAGGAAAGVVVFGGWGVGFGWLAMRQMQSMSLNAGTPPGQPFPFPLDPLGIAHPELVTGPQSGQTLQDQDGKPFEPSRNDNGGNTAVNEFFAPFVARDPVEQAMIDAAKQRLLANPSPEALRRGMTELDQQLTEHRRQIEQIPPQTAPVPGPDGNVRISLKPTEKEKEDCGIRSHRINQGKCKRLAASPITA